MNVLLICECDKRALHQTRRILDQFAERRGERTWQTAITEDGLQTLRRLLRKTARKNTAVACHWIRGLDHSELLWIVGDASRFNARGAVPTHTTARKILRSGDENDWHYGTELQLLTQMAALLHDLGKACDDFQARLTRGSREMRRNRYRHEWISLRLFEAFVGDDDDTAWLRRLSAPTADDDARWIARLHRDGIDEPAAASAGAAAEPPLRRLQHAPLAQALGWLVVTHHRLPEPPYENRNGTYVKAVIDSGSLQNTLQRITAAWNEGSDEHEQAAQPYWTFSGGLPITTPDWRKRAARLAERLLQRTHGANACGWLDNPYLMHLSRLCLILADHRYSSLEGAAPGRYELRHPPQGLWANTTGDQAPNQHLEEHLLGVARLSGELTHALPRFETHLPALGHVRALRKPATDTAFRWQNQAAELAAAQRQASHTRGAFIVNMASTGCGKTLANLRIMDALADPERGPRCAFALGLRVLTLQTGQAYRERLQLHEEHLAVLTGGSASRELYETYADAEARGSASTQALLGSSETVHYEGGTHEHPLLKHLNGDPRIAGLLLAPLLVCTIDHLMPASESTRGGHGIAPTLRLLSGDLVLDEFDDFDLQDLPALTRLVHRAGMLGARVLLSSATSPPALIQGLYAAYQNGRAHYHRNRGLDAQTGTPGICCLWIDEFSRSAQNCGDMTSYAQAHAAFAQRRHDALSRQAASEARRRACIVALELDTRSEAECYRGFVTRLNASAAELHRAHRQRDPLSGKHLSFGLVRMANIKPLYETALHWFRSGAPPGLRIHLCVYHSQFPLLLRSSIERRLDAVLDRRDPERVYRHPAVRRLLDAHADAEHAFIVLGSPITEVGRDHDYDWAIAEPSSMRSLIQLAGRIRRHRRGACSGVNLHLLGTNLRHWLKPQDLAYTQPGFEDQQHRLQSHHLEQLLAIADYETIDARPRIVEPASLHGHTRLVDLEHQRLREQMLPASQSAATKPRGLRTAHTLPPLNAASIWQLPPRDALYTAQLQRRFPFRAETQVRKELCLMPDADGDTYGLRVEPDLQSGRYSASPQDWPRCERALLQRLGDTVVHGNGIAPWWNDVVALDAEAGDSDLYLSELRTLAEDFDLSLQQSAARFGRVTVPQNDDGWQFHPALGFSIVRR